MSCLILTILSALLSSTSGAADESHPNILLLVADDMRPNLGCLQQTNSAHFSSPQMFTPNLDLLASQSLLLENAFVQQAAPPAEPLCSQEDDQTRQESQTCIHTSEN